jgi:hypothetical protein
LVFEVTGVDDGFSSTAGCECINGTYVFDAVQNGSYFNCNGRIQGLVNGDVQHQAILVVTCTSTSLTYTFYLVNTAFKDDGSSTYPSQWDVPGVLGNGPGIKVTGTISTCAITTQYPTITAAGTQSTNGINYGGWCGQAGGGPPVSFTNVTGISIKVSIQ